MSLTPTKQAELRLRAAEAEVQAAREALDALRTPADKTSHLRQPTADYTHEMKLSEKQTHILAEALEFYARWCMGHFVLPNVIEFRTLPERDPYGRPCPRAGQSAVEDWDCLRSSLDYLRSQLFPEFGSPNAHGGVGWSGYAHQQHMQIAYELYKSLLSERNHRLGIDNVHSGAWLHYSDQPRPLVHVYDAQLGVQEWKDFISDVKRRFPVNEKSGAANL